MAKFVHNYRRFYEDVYKPQTKMFRQLAQAQEPRVLFITCSDSRVCPNLLLQADPGEVFVLRNAGNLVPPEEAAGGTAEAATIEFALGSLPIEDVIVCGHSGCGAMAGILEGLPEREPQSHLGRWLRHAVSANEVVAREGIQDRSERLRQIGEANLVKQLTHLRSHRAVAQALAEGRIRLHAWYYDIAAGQIRHLCEEHGDFALLDAGLTEDEWLA